MTVKELITSLNDLCSKNSKAENFEVGIWICQGWYKIESIDLDSEEKEISLKYDSLDDITRKPYYE